ncbi:hypothetical protein BDZ90DRAFT_248139 [Jaminaea rosea]|uniref:J domain-containing protein n=1 Tax=Jaminaea rosea TaxID=1569628 RepID=A0A316V526_9BASI|nr:hypothetical protein BDZ90DRAFT_248139 [Jaminaea rosea]PWN30505.1 hypothetical protein BDZ90DRAFT_248139 [Jaminaea rosea]
MDAAIDDPYGESAQGSSSASASASTSSRAAPPRAASPPRSHPPSSRGNHNGHANTNDEDDEDEESPSNAAESDHEILEHETDRYYALLNVDREATPDQIREAYRSLAVALHPDKHLEPRSKAAAQSRFRDIQRAYEVLSDREKRTVYDHFGEEGLNSTWTVSTRGRSPEELRREFERQKEMKKEKEAADLVRSRGEFTAQIDATGFFAPAHAIRRRPAPRPAPAPSTAPTAADTAADRASLVQVRSLMGKHGFDVPLAERTTVNFSGQMLSRNGSGGGNFLGTVKHQWSPRLQTDLMFTLMKPRIVQLKGQYQINEFSFFNWTVGGSTTMLPPSFNVTYGQRLSNESPLTGFTTVRSGTYTLGPWGRAAAEAGLLRMDPPSVLVGLTSQHNSGKGWTVSTTIGLSDTNVNLERGLAPIKWLGGARLRMGLSVGSGSGASVHLHGDKRVTEGTDVGVGVTAGLPGGVTMRVSFNRLGQKVALPILLAPAPRADLVIAATALPLMGLFAAESLYLAPKRKRKVRGRLAELRRDNWDLIRQRRRAAKEGVEALRSQARKRASSERAKGGLIVIEAWYGRADALPVSEAILEGAVDAEELDRRAWLGEARNAEAEASSPSSSAQPLYCDVRIPLQALVSRSGLVIPGGRSKSNLLGFYDAAMGERKVLRVRYLFRGQVHEATFADKDAVACPLRAHQL